MKAVVHDRFGGPEVVRLADRPRPEPGRSELLIRVTAAAVTTADCRIRAQNAPRGFGWIMRLMFGIRRPRKPVLGNAFAGEIVAVGAKVTRFRPGQQVFGATGMRMGAHAQFLCLPETAALADLPRGFGPGAAASFPFGGLTALTVVKTAKIRAGERVLVNGGSGAVGRMVVQLAAKAGAEVTAVGSAGRADLMREMGAARVIDYRQCDLATLQDSFDVIVDTTGKHPFPVFARLLSPVGRFCAVILEGDLLWRAIWSGLRRDGRVIGILAEETTEAMDALRGLMESGALRNPVSHFLPLEAAAEAHRLVETGEAPGAVVLLPDSNVK